MSGYGRYERARIQRSEIRLDGIEVDRDGFRTPAARTGAADLVDALVVELEQPLGPFAHAGLRGPLTGRGDDDAGRPGPRARGQIEDLSDGEPRGRRFVVRQVAHQLKIGRASCRERV